MGKMIKQAQRIQKQMEEVQATLAAKTVEATSGGGAVKVVAKCDGTVSSIKIDPAALNPNDAQILEEMLISAVNNAMDRPRKFPTRKWAASHKA
jgi:nucleoid-associated protein EbfC